MAQKQKLSSEQDMAANPAQNVWVQANAGTGKTSVLIQRLLRILFRSPEPTKTGVLCLTYTNAAAGEMKNRILSELRKWAAYTDDDLRDLLVGVSTNNVPTDKDIAYARKLFFIYIDNQDMLKIKTIHGFCEEILHRFPIEAGISPAWNLISDETQRVMLQDAFAKMLTSNAVETIAAFDRIVNRVSEYSMPKLLSILSNQYKDFFDVDDFVKYRKYFIDKTSEFLNTNTAVCEVVDTKKLENIIEYCQKQQKVSKKPAKYLTDIINTTKQYIDKTTDFEKYKTVYLKADGEPIANIQKQEVLQPEQDRVYKLNRLNENNSIFKDTVALFDLSAAFAKNYKQIKQQHNALDFEDLILYARKLFSNPETMGWVLSQMDVSLSHILVDEAQDTGPLQWDIMRMLAGDFFTDGDTGEIPHSLFVVGDTKQSIYGFMGADPYAFASSRKIIGDQIKNNLRTIREIPLTQSFRSLSSILYAVDTLFNNENVKRISGFVNNNHISFRRGSAGVVDVHKLSSRATDGTTLLEYIKDIAIKIKSMIDFGTYSPSDIMILVQNRNPMAAPMVAELKRLNIPVAGSDRIVLPNFPAVSDLLNLVRFCIDITDDYRLCCVLKSPLYRFSESDIYNLCIARNKANTELSQTTPDYEPVTVFSALQSMFPNIYNDLQQIIAWAGALAPYSFFTAVLQHNDTRQKMIAALGDQIIDPLEEFLTICLAYERTQPGTLRHFIKWFITSGAQIKRDMDASSGVRVMTVHGSKGLQSRVVFLIDTVRTPDKDSIVPIPDSIAWLWMVSGQNNTDESNVALDAAQHETIAEYYRLLYVAMTRACDELYIYGYTPYKNAPDISWHSQIWNVLSGVPGATTTDNTIRIIHD